MEMSKWVLVFVITCISTFIISGTEEKQNPNQGLSVNQMIAKYQYPQENHRVTTEDGYILTMHRIPYGKMCQPNCIRKPLLLMHGLLSSSVDFVNTRPSNALAFLLADAGFDVWLGNARGNTHSRKHKTLNPNTDSDFWQFSWNEIGYYDLPAKIDYILNYTGHNDLFYIGHSQGTTTFFVMTSERPQYNSKVRLMVALSPIVFMSNMENLLLKYIAKYHNIYETAASVIGLNEFAPNQPLLAAAGQMICKEESQYIELCSNYLFIVNGWDSKQLNRSVIPVILSNAPAGCAFKQLLHYAQEIRSGRFCKYDFGETKNKQVYGKLTPPDYKLFNTKTPVALFYSENDALAAVVDVEKLSKLLPNVAALYKVPMKEFNHVDFLWAIDVVDLVYKPALKLMNRYIYE